jgi:hypothetical protein
MLTITYSVGYGFPIQLISVPESVARDAIQCNKNTRNLDN